MCSLHFTDGETEALSCLGNREAGKPSGPTAVQCCTAGLHVAPTMKMHPKFPVHHAVRTQ